MITIAGLAAVLPASRFFNYSMDRFHMGVHRKIHNILIFIFITFSSPLLADDQLKRRFFEEAPQGWIALENFALGLQGLIVDTQVPKEGLPADQNSVAQHHFKYFNGNLLYRWEADTSAGLFDIVLARNSEYAFKLHRDGPSRPWVIEYVGQDEAGIVQQIKTIGSPVFVSCSIDGQLLSWTINQPTFALKGIEHILKGDRAFVQIRFESDDYIKEDYRITRGRVLLDPTHSWSVQEYDLEVHLDQPAQVTGNVEYDGENEGLPLPRRFVKNFRAVDSLGRLHRQRICEYRGLKRANGVEAEVMLNAFGLPEPNLSDSSYGSRFLLFGFGILALIFGLILRRRAVAVE